MNRAEKRRQMRLAIKVAKKKRSTLPAQTTAQSPQPQPPQQTMTIQQAIDIGVQHHNSGDLPKAEGIYQQILQIEPNQHIALHFLGVIAHQVGKYDVAVELIGKALAIKPDYAEAQSNLGNALQEQGKLGDAVASYRKALAKKPDFAEAHNNLGNALREGGKLDDAVASYRKAIAIKHDYAEPHNNLGNVLQKFGKLDDAVERYHKALAIKPDYAEAHYNIGKVFQELDKQGDAVACYYKAIAIEPDFFEAYNNLGIAFYKLGKLDDAVASYHKALAIKPGYAKAYNNLGNTLKDQGKLNNACASYRKALVIEPDKYGWHIRMALALPVILWSLDEIHSVRSQLVDLIQKLLELRLVVDDPILDIGTTNFFLAYHDQNNKSILESIAQLHVWACPKIAYKAMHCDPEYNRKPGRMRIGFLSSYLRNHTIGKLFKGIIEHFSSDQFEIIVFQSTRIRDEVSEAIYQSAEKVVPLHKKLEQDWECIASEKLDVLFYPDIGMDPYTYFLSFARLAPVQIVSWGHPDTTGIPNIDYFLSSELIEPEGSSNHYTEQLAQLSLMPTFYYRPKPPERTYSRTDYDLPETGAIYVCPQTLFKLHPDFDLVIAELLRKDKSAFLVLINDNVGGHLKKLVEERFEATFPDVSDRVIFVSRMNMLKYMGLTMLADAVLDVPSFSGGNSTLEAFAMSVPIVTWPGEFMRGRVTAGYYTQMGLNELIASNAETYVELAYKLAHDNAFKSRMQSDIMENSHKLFERIEVVREMELFFIEAHNSWQNGKHLSNEEFRAALDTKLM